MAVSLIWSDRISLDKFDIVGFNVGSKCTRRVRESHLGGERPLGSSLRMKNEGYDSDFTPSAQSHKFRPESRYLVTLTHHSFKVTY